MNKAPDISDVREAITLQNGDRIILVKRLGKRDWPKDEHATNIFRLNGNGEIVWRVKSDFDSYGDTFTGIFIKDEKLNAYRWDDWTYEIDLATGQAVKVDYSR